MSSFVWLMAVRTTSASTILALILIMIDQFCVAQWCPSRTFNYDEITFNYQYFIKPFDYATFRPNQVVHTIIVSERMRGFHFAVGHDMSNSSDISEIK